MALETFKVQLNTYLKGKKVNLSKTRIDALAAKLDKKNPDITEMADHDTAIADMDEFIGFADIAKQDDKIRTLEAKTKVTTKKEDEEEEEEEETSKPKADRTPAWAKALIQEVQTLKAEKKTTSIKQQIADKLKGKEIPEKFYGKRALPDKEEDLDAFVSEIETDWTELKQDTNNSALGSSTKPAGGSGGADSKKIDPDIIAFGKKQTEKLTTKTS